MITNTLGCKTKIPFINENKGSLALISVLDNNAANRKWRVVSEFSRLEIMCSSVRPIERAMREPRMDPQSTVFPAQPCRP
jgi:hypothetical protein